MTQIQFISTTPADLITELRNTLIPELTEKTFCTIPTKRTNGILNTFRSLPTFKNKLIDFTPLEERKYHS